MSSAPPGLISTPSRLPDGSFQTFCFAPPGPRVYTSPVWLNDTTTRVPSGRTVMPLGEWRSGLFTTTATFPDGPTLQTASAPAAEHPGRTPPPPAHTPPPRPPATPFLP